MSDGAAALEGPVPDDPLEPRRRGRRPGRARGPRGAGRAVRAPTGIPIYAFIRRKGHGPEEALDLTQDYFARLLEKGTLAAADPGRGRFRAFLRADCGFFLADRRDRDAGPEARRGPGRRSRSTPATPRAATCASRPTD